MECSHCGLQFIDPVPDQKRLNEIYADYYNRWGIESSGENVSKMKTNTFRDYIEKITRFTSTGRLLDIGCATGELMLVAQEKGFDVFGVEISPQGIDRCRELFGKEKIVTHALRGDEFPSGYFDVITMSDVFEHIIEPHSHVNILWNFLKHNGLLMLVTPDTSSWSKRIMKMRWPHYKEEHVYYYSSHNITGLFSDRFETIILTAAHKNLTLQYGLNVLKKYSESNTFRNIGGILKYIPRRVKIHSFKINFGEMFVLLRKKFR